MRRDGGTGVFKAREYIEAGAGGPIGAALLSRAMSLEPEALRPTAPRGWRERLARIDWAPDLAERVATRPWYRGLGTLTGLTLGALSLWPNFAPLEAAAPLPTDAQVRDEFRSLSTTPIAFGSEHGRRMHASARVVPLAAAPERPRLSLTATVGAGDSLARLLQRVGVGAGDAAQATGLVARAVSLSEIEPGTKLELVLGRRPGAGQPRPLDRMALRARFDLALSVERGAEGLTLIRQPIPVDATPLRIKGVVGASLYRSARAAGAPARVIQQYLQALDGQLSLESDIAPGDRFDIIVAHRRAASGDAETGDLLYAALDRGGKQRAELLRWRGGGLVSAASVMPQPQRAGLLWPVNGRITSGYGLRRHPILRYARMHAGIDFGAAHGSPIVAVSDGVVAYAGRRGGHGNYVRLEHGGGIGTGYGHMSRIAVAPGSRVRAGQVIGYVGSTGLSTGPHLHYELYRNGRTSNPLGHNFVVRPQIDPGEAAAFKARLRQLKATAVGGPTRIAGSGATKVAGLPGKPAA